MTDDASDGAFSHFARLRLLATDTIVYGLASAINKSFALILFPLLTRELTVEDYGRVDYALYTAALFGLLVVWGQDSAVARLFFEEEDKKAQSQIISQAFVVMGATLVIALVAMAIAAISPFASTIFGRKSGSIALLLLILAPVTGLLSFCQSLLKWTFQRNRYLIVALGVPATNLSLLVAIAHWGQLGPVNALAVMTAVNTVFLGVALLLIREWLAIPKGLSDARELIPLAVPYGLIAAISALTPLVERSVVSGRFGAEDLGLYAAAAKIASLATMLAIAFQMGWGPFSYSIYKHPNAAQTYNLVLRVFVALMCCAVLTLAALAGPVTGWLAGARYERAGILVFPMAMAFGVQAIGWITEIGIHLSKRTYLNLPGFAAFLAISVGGILMLSRTFGILGVPLGALAGQIAMLLISATIAQRAFPLAWSYRLPLLTVLATLISGVAALASPLFAPAIPAWCFFLAGLIAIATINLLSRRGREDFSRLCRLVFRNRQFPHS